MREALRGALLSVLFFVLLIGGAPTMAQYADGVSDSESTEEDSGDTPGASNPHSNPLGGDLTGGGDPAPDVWVPPICIGSAGGCADNQVETLGQFVDEACALAKQASLLGAALGGTGAAAAGFWATIRAFFKRVWSTIGAQSAGKLIGGLGLVEAAGALCALGGR